MPCRLPYPGKNGACEVINSLHGRKIMKSFFGSPLSRNIFSAVAIPILGFILLNLTFLFDFAYQEAIRYLIGLFVPLGPDMPYTWLPPLFHGSFVAVIGGLSWLVFRARLGVFLKAAYMTVPTAVVLVTVGMFLYSGQVISYSVGALLCAGTLYYFYRTRQPWLYYYSVILVALALAIFTLLGGEI